MKKFLLGLSFITLSALAASTFTTNYNLEKPSDGDTGWGSAIRDSFDTIDTQLAASNSGLAAHLADTVDAHDASAVSATSGDTCTSSDTVQEFLDCLDENIFISVGGSIMTTNTTQTVTGAKTFTQTIVADSGVDGDLAGNVVGETGLFSTSVTTPTIVNTGTLTLPTSTDTLVGKATTDTFTNKTIDADGTGNSITNIENADIKALAAIARTKIASGTASHVVINDGDGVLSSEASLAITRGGTGAATKAAAFDALSPMTTSGDIIYGGASGTGTRLAKGSDGTVLTLAAGLPSWGLVPDLVEVRTVTSAGSVTTDDDIVLADSTGGTFQLDLPAAASAAGKQLTITKIDANFTVITIDANSSETINGAANTTLNSQYESVQIVSDGSNWIIAQRRIPSGWLVGSITGVINASTTDPTLATGNLFIRRIGNALRMRIDATWTNANIGSGTYFIVPPSSLTIDSALLGTFTPMGFGAIYNTSDTQEHSTVAHWNNSRIEFFYNTGANYLAFTSAQPNGTSTRSFYAEVDVPISGWSN